MLFGMLFGAGGCDTRLPPLAGRAPQPPCGHAGFGHCPDGLGVSHEGGAAY